LAGLQRKWNGHINKAEKYVNICYDLLFIFNLNLLFIVFAPESGRNWKRDDNKLRNVTKIKNLKTSLWVSQFVLYRTCEKYGRTRHWQNCTKNWIRQQLKSKI